MNDLTLIGLLAASLTTLAFIPQSIRVLRTRNTDGVSLVMYVMFVSGVLVWMYYAFLKNDIAVLGANACTFMFALPTLVIKVMNSRKEKRAVSGP